MMAIAQMLFMLYKSSLSVPEILHPLFSIQLCWEMMLGQMEAKRVELTGEQCT